MHTIYLEARVIILTRQLFAQAEKSASGGFLQKKLLFVLSPGFVVWAPLFRVNKRPIWTTNQRM